MKEFAILFGIQGSPGLLQWYGQTQQHNYGHMEVFELPDMRCRCAENTCECAVHAPKEAN